MISNLWFVLVLSKLECLDAAKERLATAEIHLVVQSDGNELKQTDGRAITEIPAIHREIESLDSNNRHLLRRLLKAQCHEKTARYCGPIDDIQTACPLPTLVIFRSVGRPDRRHERRPFGSFA